MTGPALNRRQLLVGAAVAAGAAAFPSIVLPSAAGAVTPGPAGGSAPFLLGVASGDPLPDSVILWTRLVRDVFDARSMSRRAVVVRWEIAHDERFRRPARTGFTLAQPELAHSVHVDARGLEPDREYFYRFTALGERSPVGRTRTAPSRWARPDQLRLGVVNCQDFQNGYWPSYHGLAEEDLDVVLHLGDYIYEYDPHSGFADRNHVAPQTPGLDQLSTLDDYRNRHAQYKGDPALQAAHAAFAWIVTWDDHETENNYANLVDEIDDTGAQRQTPEQFAAQRASAYQAYYEHMPIRADLRPGSADLRIFRRFDFGQLARLNVLDTRQYRTDQPGGFPSDFGLVGAGTGNTAGTLTGADPALVPPTVANLDQWDGYVPQRTRLLQLLADARVPNPVVLAGDIHSTWLSELKLDFDRPDSPSVAVEFVAPSVSSDFPVAFDAPVKAANPILNPHVRYFDGLLHGYLRCEVTRQHWQTDVRVVDTIAVRDAPTRTQISFVAESGQSHLQPA
jgi:alkaline phosphatase D